MARAIVLNAKTVRPSVCNAMDTLLVHSAVADRFVPMIAEALAAHDVTLHPDERALPLSHAAPTIAVIPEDYDREWLSLDCSVRIVDSLEEAMDHIETHGSGHSEAIVTESYSAAQRFQREVDAAAVFVNASTYFNDGGQFGLGCEQPLIHPRRNHAKDRLRRAAVGSRLPRLQCRPCMTCRLNSNEQRLCLWWASRVAARPPRPSPF